MRHAEVALHGSALREGRWRGTLSSTGIAASSADKGAVRKLP